MRNPETAWSEEAPGTGPAEADAAAPSSGLGVAALLDSLPLGLRVTGANGALVYRNHAYSGLAAQAGDPASGSVSTRSMDFSVDGEAFTATLLIDDAEQASREQALIRRAYFDELTGLPNRRIIEQSVGALISSSETPFALAFVDVDGFKHVNDFYGHNVGDALLVKIAERVSSNLRPSDMLARLSGDEFVLLLSPANDAEQLKQDVAAVSAALKQPFYIDGNEILSSASIGVSVYPRDGGTYDALRANADRAMYRCKGLGTGSVQFFDASIEHAAIEKSRLEQRLRLAIRDRRVSCAYQPKMDIQTGNVSGVEVLLRWIDEDGMIQPPGDFIALAIDLGLMDDLTYMVLDKTIQSIDRINEAFGATVSISLNVAAKQAGDVTFMRSLLDRIAATDFAKRFILEITEEAFVSKSSFQESVLPLIREVGARVSIDDFGVGYSSLSALADITADEVKIDRSFITNLHQRPRSQNILKAIEALSRSLGMDVIVEGLETFEELAYLRACTSIRYVQGYYFSKPMMLEELNAQKDDTARQQTVTRPNVLTRNYGGRGM